MPNSIGRAYYDKKVAAGKNHNEAMRCLKRRLADRVWRVMIADQRTAEKAAVAGPGGHVGAATKSSAADPTPSVNSSDKSLPGPTDADPTTG